MAAVQGLPSPAGRGARPTAPSPGPHQADVDRLAAAWAGLAPGPGRSSPLLHARLVALLRRLGACCRDDPLRPLDARALGADLLHSGLCGDVRGPLRRAHEVLAPSLALLREHGPGVLGPSGPPLRITAVLDELAAGFAAALRDRVRGGHDDPLPTPPTGTAAPDVPTPPRGSAMTEHRAVPGAGARSASVDLVRELSDGLVREEFRLHYQPLVALADGRVRAAEALVRWQHPVRGLLEPARFVEAAECSGEIVPLGRWVLEEACMQAALWWYERGPEAPRVSVNVSPVELAEPGWADGVARVIDITGVPPDRLQLEITEQAMLTDGATSMAGLRALYELGVRLALDDFGTGWSGLTWLRRLPVHSIKIDGSFVDGLRHAHPDPVDVAIVGGMIRMAHEMGVEVTAEWVETAAQAEHLAVLGCDLGQGRWWGGAGPAEWVERMSPRTIG